MAYFLRNFLEARKYDYSISIDNEEDLLTASTSKFGYADPEKDIRNNYSKLLLLCAEALHKTGVLSDANLGQNLKNDSKNLESLEEIDSELIHDVNKYVYVSAQPSSFGANMLAKIIYIRYGSIFKLETPYDDSKEHPISLTIPPSTSILEENQIFKKATDYQLVAIGLESIFSVLLELNQRDPELCVQALQSLLQLLQNLAPEALIHESKVSIEKMHSLLKQLRVEGNSAVSSYANACMISLSVAYGSPEFLFSSICALLCDQKRNVPYNQISSDCNLLPKNFQNLAVKVQKCVQHGYNSKFNFAWWSCGLSEHMKLREYDLVYPGSLSSSDIETPDVSVRRGCLVSDGAHVYVLTLYGLFKMGTGLTETNAGKVVNCNEILKFIEGSSLHICNESLYLRRRHSPRLWVIDTETLREIGEIMLPSTLSDGVLFSDGKTFLHETMDDQWHFITTPLDDAFVSLPNQRLRHSTRLLEIEYSIFGDSNHMQQNLLKSIPNHLQLVTADLQLEQELGFLLTRHGKIHFSGNVSSVGLQDTNQWEELDLSETIVSMSFDNISKCLYLKSGSGHLWVVGTPNYVETRYSQGTSKRIKKVRIQNRRKCTSLSSINGALAYVTDNGKSYLHGRHVVSTSLDTGLIPGLDTLPIVNIALGKTHMVAISKSGLVYTSGLNNLNQCGREDSEPQPSTSSKTTTLAPIKSIHSHTSSPSSSQHSPSTPYCQPGEHLFVKDVATICIRCGRCSSKGLKCPYANPSPNSPKVQSPQKGKLLRGAPCACGQGENTCLRCGICRTCADSPNAKHSIQKLHSYTDSDEEGTPTKQKLTISRALAIPQHEIIIPLGRLVLHKLNNDIKVSTVSCGNYHTILLCADRSVYTFGSNCHGQLGTGDTVRRNGVVQGANHCVLRTNDGQIITFGAYKNGQLGREPDGNSRFWFAEPGFAPGYGQSYGRIASWVGAQGDKTLVQTQKQIFSGNMLNECYITANKENVLILPNSIDRKPILVLRKKTGVFYQIPRPNDDMSISWALDPHYTLLWSFDADRMKVTSYTDVVDPDYFSEDLDYVEPEFFKCHRLLVQTPELLIPTELETLRYSDFQLAIYMLTTIYSLSITAAVVPNLGKNENNKDEKNMNRAGGLKDTTMTSSNDKNGYYMINRFENYGGGWGYSAHCIEAIQFKTNKDFYICGVGLFGGRGEYVAKLKLFHVIGGTEVEEQCVELLSETDEVLYECGPRETAVLQFSKNITIKAGEWHVIWAQIQGPSSDCGAGGQNIVRSEGDIEFIFRNSLLSNNGTDMDVGQIPEIYYRLVNENSPNKESLNHNQKRSNEIDLREDTTENLPFINSGILFSISPKTATYIFKVFEWAVRGSFAARDYGEMQDDEAIWRQERAGFIAILALRMLRLYIGILYSEEKAEQNLSIDILVDFHNLINQLFDIADEKLFFEDRVGALVVDEAVDTFVSCSHFLIPSPKIFQNRLSQAIAKSKRSWSLLALLKSVYRLDKFILPLLKTDAKGYHTEIYFRLSEKLEEYFSPGEDPLVDLTDQMVPAFPNDRNAQIPAISQRIIKFLFELAFRTTTDSVDADLLLIRLKKVAQQLISLISKELVLNKIKTSKKYTLLQTPNRFRKTLPQINWDTGNGASDAIAFKVDISGVFVNGFGVYLGNSAQYNYDLELLINTGDIANESWNVLEKSTGILNGKFLEPTSDKGIAVVRLQKSVKIQPDVMYAVRLVLNGGKTLYGEGGICTIKLCNHGKLTYLPCSLSKNGTTIVRGQIPFLLYSIEEEETKEEEQMDKNFEEQLGSLEEKPFQNDIPKNLFILIIRLMSKKLSVLTATGEISTDDQSLCSQIIAYSNVFIEANPSMAFNIISAFDELLPLITSANADEVKSNQVLSRIGSSFIRKSEKPIRHFEKFQVLVESPHPYKSGQLYSQMVNFEKNVEFMSVRFQDECQTAHVEDILWIYVGVDEKSFMPIGRYSGAKNWPENCLLVPGNCLWFIFETGTSSADGNKDRFYGYRCTVDGFLSGQNTPGLVLEEEFVWLCANSCRLLVQAPDSETQLKKLMLFEQETKELIKKHGPLLKRGLNLTHVPVMNEVLNGKYPKTVTSDQNLLALHEFIEGKNGSPMGNLFKTITSEPYIDTDVCTIFLENNEVHIGKASKIELILKDQYQNEVFSSKINAEAIIFSGDNQESHKNLLQNKTMQHLKQLQMQEPYHSVYQFKTRYKAITAMPVFSSYCFEELRLSYQQEFTHKENLKFILQEDRYTAQWVPKRTGKFKIEATIDGFKLASSASVEVFERGTPLTPIASPKKSILLQKQLSSKKTPSRATCDALSSFKGIRIRTHPSLSAQQIGYIPRGTTVSYIEQLRNHDGIWLRLTDEVKILYCDPKVSGQAWTMQYNAHMEMECLKLHQTNGNTIAQQWESNIRIEYEGVKSPVIDMTTPRTPFEPVRRSSFTQEAISPLTIDCCRSVFAAFLWHEHLVEDLLTCSNHLKSKPDLLNMFNDEDFEKLPNVVQKISRIWKDVLLAVLQVIEQHLIMPSPPAMREFAFYPIRNFPSVDEPYPGTSNENNQDELCELCEELYPKPITHHMRMKHPGCGLSSNGHGYNSIGNYTTGWSGNCGDGGRENAVWYLLCPNCRDKYLKNTSNILKQERNKDWREFRMKTANKQLRPEVIMKQNGIFLLELKANDKENMKSGIKIDLYPQVESGAQQIGKNLENEDEILSEDYVDYTEPTIYRQYSHLSDPGSFLANRSQSEIVSIHGVSSLSASANMFRQHKNPTQRHLASLPSTSLGTYPFHNLPYSANIFKHPIFLFIVENHDLSFIRKCFYTSISRAARFSYAFRVWNWLLKMVTAENSVHDIIWHYIEALNSYVLLNPAQMLDMKFATKLRLLPHPWRLSFLGGDAAKQMVGDMHSFLGTLAVILQSHSVEIGLKCLCFRAWTFQLTRHEQNLLLTMCNILSTVGAVLSDTNAEIPASVFNASESSSIIWRRNKENQSPGGRILRRNSSSHNRVSVKSLDDVTNFAKIECSSRSALIHYLVDGSLETFWESGDEDRNRVRRIIISWDSNNCIGMLVGIFIDNVRDEGYKINQITIKCLEKLANKSLPLYNSAIDRTYVGWIKCCVRGTNAIQVFMKGDETGCRVRQFSLYGYGTAERLDSPAKKELNPSVSHHLLFSTAQIDAFMLFQAIAAQAFSDELAEEYNGTLRQQVLEMLFSRTQLQPLQSYVCYQMVTAVEREIANLRDHSKKNYSYICALMIMLVKICEFRKGLEVFSMRNGLLILLSELLLFAPETVQYQVIETIGCLLKHFRPSSIDCSQFLINILAAVSKTVSLQVKDRISRKISTQTMGTNAMDLPQHWRSEKPWSYESGLLLTNLIGRLTSGSITDQWAFAIRAELANTVMNLAKVFATSSISSESMASTSVSSQSSMSFTSRTALCLKTVQFWLAVAALGMINDASWLELSATWRSLKSKRNKETERLCENHDDGHTLAQYRCELCEIDLCRECFTILHLNKKKKNHQGRLISSSNLCPKLDIHEGCTRLRINNLLILFNASKLNGMVEITADLGPTTSFPLSGSSQQLAFQPMGIGKCRFCGNMLKSESEYLTGVCDYPECSSLAQYACEKILSCGHFCGGIKDETKCLPCFYCQPSGSQKQDSDDLCVICFVDRLGAAPCIQLKCGHLFHFNCVRTILEKKWAGPRIVFRFMHCPLCKQKIEHPALQDLLHPLLELYSDVAKKAKLRLEYDGLLNSPILTTENGEFFNDPVGFAMERYVYVLCAKCHKAYFGGESRCQESLEASNYNPEELVCGGCSDVAAAAVCGRHGTEFLEYKCRFCCSVAVYFCFGSTHFCTGCHSDFQRLMTLPKHLLPKCPVGPRCVQLEDTECPLKIQHPSTGEEFSLGCGICRNIRTF